MKLDKMLYFVLGAAAGAATTFFVVNKKYQKMYEEDVASVKAELKKKSGDEEPEEKTETIEPGPLKKADFSPEEKTEYHTISKQYNGNEEAVRKPEDDEPVVISPEEFGDIEEYPKYSLYYYADGVIADEMDDPIDDIASTVGLDSVNHFGDYDYDPDTVYIRNDKKKCYYELLMSLKLFSEIPR